MDISIEYPYGLLYVYVIALGGVLNNGFLYSLMICSNYFINLLPTFEKKKSWHGPDTTLLSNRWDSICVQLVEFNTLEVLRKLNDLWGNHPARTAPDRMKVDNNQLLWGSFCDFFLVILGGLEFINHFHCGYSSGGVGSERRRRSDVGLYPGSVK